MKLGAGSHGGDVTAEELGGAELHSTTSGVTDHLAENEAHALSITRHILGNMPAPEPRQLGGDKHRDWEEPLHPASELRGGSAALVLQ